MILCTVEVKSQGERKQKVVFARAIVILHSHQTAFPNLEILLPPPRNTPSPNRGNTLQLTHKGGLLLTNTCWYHNYVEALLDLQTFAIKHATLIVWIICIALSLQTTNFWRRGNQISNKCLFMVLRCNQKSIKCLSKFLRCNQMSNKCLSKFLLHFWTWAISG